jgi:thiol-disulfide isomerase/thioredoxin
VAALVLLALVLAGCGSPGAPQALEPVTAPDAPPVLRVRGPTVSDGVLDLSTYAGRPLALWFWSPDCVTCRREAATAQVLHDVNPGAVVGVTCGDPAEARVFEDDVGATFPTVLDRQGDLATLLELSCQPAWAFVAADGSVAVETRVLDLDELREHLEAGAG